jgi:hypothetical protein
MKTLLTNYDFRMAESEIAPGTHVITSIDVLRDLQRKQVEDLRDKFAMAAFAGLNLSMYGTAKQADEAYKCADAMLQRRRE